MRKPHYFAVSFMIAAFISLGCKSENKSTSSPNEPASPASSASPTPTLPSSASGSDSSVQAPPAAGDPNLATLFAGPPDEPKNPVLPLKLGEVNSGISAILPTDCTGGDMYGDDLVMMGPGTEAVVVFRYEPLSGPRQGAPTPEQTPEPVRKGMAFAAKVNQVVWEPPVAGKVGERQADAMIWRGKGSFVGGGQIGWNVYAVAAYLGPDTKVNIVGTWNAARPSLEKAVISAIKSVRK